MAATHTGIRIAAQGWHHVAWQSDFYPHDLPIDWRLSYYSNEFSAVTVPTKEWAAADAGEVQAWVEDTHEDFLFYPEVEATQTDWIDFASKAQFLGEQLGGILLRPGAGQGDIREIISSFEQASAITPSCMLAGDRAFTDAEEALLAKEGVTLAWRIENPENIELQREYVCSPGHGRGALLVIQMAGDAPYSSRKLRDIIEAGLRRDVSFDNSRVSGGRMMLLMFEGDAADIGTVRAAGIISDLLEMPAVE